MKRFLLLLLLLSNLALSYSLALPLAADQCQVPSKTGLDDNDDPVLVCLPSATYEVPVIPFLPVTPLYVPRFFINDFTFSSHPPRAPPLI